MSLKDSYKKLRKLKSSWDALPPKEAAKKELEYIEKLHEPKTKTKVGQVRITAGRAKNRKIDIPVNTRPLTDRMKIRTFDIIGPDIKDKTILDLYAGSGSFGLEAISRGAKEATLVDSSKKVEKVLKSNISITDLILETEIIRKKSQDYLEEIIADEKTFDIIFLDPPYQKYSKHNKGKIKHLLDLTGQCLPGLKTKKLFKGAVIVKHPSKFKIEEVCPENLELLESIVFGNNTISFFIIPLKRL